MKAYICKYHWILYKTEVENWKCNHCWEKVLAVYWKYWGQLLASRKDNEVFKRLNKDCEKQLKIYKKKYENLDNVLSEIIDLIKNGIKHSTLLKIIKIWKEKEGVIEEIYEDKDNEKRKQQLENDMPF